MRSNATVSPLRASALAVVAALFLAACSKAPEEIEASAAQHLAVNESRAAMIKLKDLLQRDPERARARFLLGRSLNDQGDYAGAENEFRRAAALGYDANDVAPMLARALLYQGKLDELGAEPSLDLAKDAVAQASVLASRASALIARGETDQALSMLERALKLAPKAGEPKAAMGNFLIDQGRLDEAASLLSTGLQEDPRSAVLNLAYGAYQRAAGRPDEALPYLRKASELAVSPPRDRNVQRAALAAMGDLELGRQRFAEVEPILKSLEALGSSRVAALLRARLNILKGDLGAARGVLEPLVANGAADGEASLLLGIVTMTQGNTEQAEMYLSGALAAQPQNPTARRAMAELRMRQEKPAEALVALGADTASLSGAAMTLAVQAHLALGDRGEALAVLQRAADAGASPIDVARGFLLAKEPARALEALRRAASTTATDAADLEGVRLAAMVAAGDGGGARAAARALATRDSGNAAVQAMLGDFFTSVRDYGGAATAYARAAVLAPGDASLVLRQARLDVLQGRVKEAEARLESAADSMPASAALQSAIAELRASRGDAPSAIAALQKAQQLAPTSAVLLLREARIRLSTGDTAGALKLTEEAATRDPSDRTAVRARVAALLAAKRNADAIKVAGDASRSQVGNTELALLHASTQVAAGQVEDAIATIRAHLERAPKSVEAHAALAELQLRKGDVAAARDAARQLGKLDPQNPAIPLIDAEIALKEGRFGPAADAIALANTRAKRAELAIREFAIRRQGMLPNPDRPLRAWLERSPTDTPVSLALADYRLGTGDSGAALQLYEGVIAREPRNTIALNNLAWIEGSRKNVKRALELAERAIALAPASASVVDTYGWILLLDGQAAKAAQVLGDARTKPGAIPDLDFHYAQALVALGRPAEARTILTALLRTGKAFPTRGDAESLLAGLSKEPG
jgi:cellulose synthase operon protein C